MVYRYVPLLRAKAGEAVALYNLTPAAKDRMFPLIHLPENVPTTFAGRASQAWSGRALGLDGLYNFNATGTATHLQGMFNVLMGNGVTVVPCVDFTAPNGYLNAAGALAQAGGNGLVVKARLANLGALPAWLAAAGWQPGQVDLVVLAGHIADIGPGIMDAPVAHALQNLPVPQSWRSVTLASSAAPKDASLLTLGANAIPRLDWDLWQSVHGATPFRLDYGDYAVSHPDLSEPPGYVMGRATVSPRYTLDGHWLIIKGRPVSGNTGVPMPVQYRSHAQTIVGTPGFGGLTGCWGDQRISQIAGTTVGGSGGRQNWVEFGVNRHLSLVADRLP